VSDDSGKWTGALFVQWWLGGFACAGAIAAGALAAVFLDQGVLASLGIAVIGAILGLCVGIGIAKAFVLIADGLGWDDKPQTSRTGRLVRRMDQVIDQIGGL